MPISETIVAQLNRAKGRNARPFDPATPTPTPRGRWGLVHYGVMVPNLPEPLRYLDAIVVMGAARVPVFDNRALLVGPPADTAWTLVGSAVTTDSFRPHRIAAETDCAPDGTRLRYGSTIAIDRGSEHIELRVARPQLTAELVLHPTTAGSHFRASARDLRPLEPAVRIPRHLSDR